MNVSTRACKSGVLRMLYTERRVTLPSACSAVPTLKFRPMADFPSPPQ